MGNGRGLAQLAMNRATINSQQVLGALSCLASLLKELVLPYLQSNVGAMEEH